MERVTGIGGILFKARDPAALAAWYRQHLGLESKDAIAEFEWLEKEEPGGAPFMINYRVQSLDRMVGQLRRAGAQVNDRIELWEPPASYPTGR